MLLVGACPHVSPFFPFPPCPWPFPAYAPPHFSHFFPFVPNFLIFPFLFGNLNENSMCHLGRDILGLAASHVLVAISVGLPSYFTIPCFGYQCTPIPSLRNAYFVQ